MDPEVRDALDTLEQRLVQKVEASAADLERKIDASAADLERKIDASASATRADLERKIEASAADLERKIDASAAETRRHMGVLAEGLRSDFRVATELLGPLVRRVADLESARDVGNQRVDVLDARVSALERIERARKLRRRR
ncbi:MAG TPA: hypothetical protein VML54_08790 [Candidatus Limnocylindrales bacterium]|nr:hypothetical protein [Candidatus Limnocylindrales bacterium]